MMGPPRRAVILEGVRQASIEEQTATALGEAVLVFFQPPGKHAPAPRQPLVAKDRRLLEYGSQNGYSPHEHLSVPYDPRFAEIEECQVLLWFSHYRFF
jgi:hypothetical protein